MESKTLVFRSLEPLGPKGDLACELLITYTMVDSQFINTPEEEANEERQTITVRISRSLNVMWALQRDDLKKVLFEHARRHIEERIAGGNFEPPDPLILDSYNAPKKCRYDPARITIPLDEPITIEVRRPFGFIRRSSR